MKYEDSDEPYGSVMLPKAVTSPQWQKGGKNMNIPDKMNRSALPHSLMLWLEDRGFNFDNPERRNYLTDDEVYSAALEVWGDMHECGNLWNEETPSWEKAQLKRFINKWSARCKQLELADWYGKGC